MTVPHSKEGFVIKPTLQRRTVKRAAAKHLAQAAKRLRQATASKQVKVIELPARAAKRQKSSVSKRVGRKADHYRQQKAVWQQKKNTTAATNTENVVPVPEHGQNEVAIVC